MSESAEGAARRDAIESARGAGERVPIIHAVADTMTSAAAASVAHAGDNRRPYRWSRAVNSFAARSALLVTGRAAHRLNASSNRSGSCISRLTFVPLPPPRLHLLPHPPPVRPHASRPDAERVGDFRIAQALDHGQVENGPLTCGQPGKHLPDEEVRLRPVGGFRAGLAPERGHPRGLEQNRRPQAEPPCAVHRGTIDDAQQPTVEPVGIGKLRQVTPATDAGILRHVLGIEVADDRAGEPRQARPARLDQPAEGRLVAVSRRRQVMVLRRHGR